MCVQPRVVCIRLLAMKNPLRALDTGEGERESEDRGSGGEGGVFTPVS